MGIIKKIIKYLSLPVEANLLVKDIEEKVEIYREEGYIDSNESNALRHYYGMKELSKVYGEDISWILGIIHEGFGMTYPEGSRELEDYLADKNNNAVALEHIEKNIGMEIDSIKTIQDVREPLQYLKIPKLDKYPPVQEY